MSKVRISDIIGLGYTNKDWKGYHVHLAVDKNVNFYEIDCEVYDVLKREFNIVELNDKKEPRLYWEGYLNERSSNNLYDEEHQIDGEYLVGGDHEKN